MNLAKAHGAALISGALTLSSACGTPHVAGTSSDPKSDGGLTIELQPADKIDLLIDIDNSPGMADKQQYFASAIPELLNRLAAPSCLDALGAATGAHADASGNCPNGSTAEFRAFRDVHVAVVSSSLGSRGGDVCDPELSPHNDDHSEVLGSSSNGSPIPNLNVGESGCGIESQLESWYRFLIQPDPYDSIEVIGGQATWSGVDENILQQRHDFLRPDSLVIIVVLSDEDDSEIDARSISGTGFQFLRAGFEPPKGTQICAVSPGDPGCTSCAFDVADPACAPGDAKYSATNDWGFDLNLRHVAMKKKYGVDAQYPLTRYVDGLTKTKVPDRRGEYPDDTGSYVGNANCTNPLFAAALPDGSALDETSLCNLSVGFSRTPDRIFLLTIGGVPNQLLHYVPADPGSTMLTPADWTKILGNDPESYDFTGIDPHMLPSYLPRAGLPGPSSANDADPISGREWITNSRRSVDLESACVFPLATPRDCTKPENSLRCSCPSSLNDLPQATAIPPWCDPASPTMQIGARAVPASRDLLLAKKLGLQGVAGSICPIHATAENTGDPLFGARPAMAALLERIKPLLQ